MLLHGSNRAASPSARARVLLLASIAALVVTSFEAHAAPLARSSASADQELASVDGAEFGARKRKRVRRGNAAGLAMMGMMVGTIGAVIATQERRRAYRRVYYDYPYGYGQPYVYQQPYLYQQPYAYQRPRVYQRSRVYHQPNVYRNANPAWHDRLQRIDPQNPNSANPTGVPRIGW